LPRGHRDNDINLEPDEVGRGFRVALISALCPAILNREVATVDPTEFAEPLHKSGNPLVLDRRQGAQESDGRQLARLLRARRKRPCRRAAQKCDELTALNPRHGEFSCTAGGRQAATPVYRALNLPDTSRQILGVDLNRSESSRQQACHAFRAASSSRTPPASRFIRAWARPSLFLRDMGDRELLRLRDQTLTISLQVKI
jgi:hypothetical protein